MRNWFVAVALFCVPFAHAQDWPSRPVRLILPFAAGGAADVVTRITMTRVGEQTGQPFLVDNRTGASGNIGTEAAARSPNDGYTLLMGTVATQTMNEFLYPSTGYDSAKDFAPVILVGMLPMVLSANPEFKASTVQEVIAAAKAQPDKVNVALPSTTARLVYELFKAKTGAPLFGVPYKASATAMTETMGGQVPLIIDTATATRGHAQSGKLKPIAITTLKTSELLPGVKSVAEQGVAGFEVTAWAAMYAPAGTPKEIVTRLNAEVAKILALPETRQRLLQLGFEPVGGTPEKLAAFEKQERAKWGPVIKAAGLKAD